MFDENDDGYWWGDEDDFADWDDPGDWYGDEPDYSSPEQRTNPTDQGLSGFYGDTSGADVYDDEGNDYWSPMYQPSTSRGGSTGGTFGGSTRTTDPSIGRASTPEKKESSGGGYVKPTPLLRSSTTTATTTPVAPTGPVPIAPEADEFEGPEWDKRYIARMAQQKAAPEIRKLRTAYQQAAGQSFENPNVKAMTLREALGGYGQGLQSAMAGGEERALREYSEKYGRDWQGEALEYQTNAQYELSIYQAAWQNYLRQYGSQTSSTTSNEYSMMGAGGDIMSSTNDNDDDIGGYSSGKRSLSGGFAYPGESMSTFIN